MMTDDEAAESYDRIVAINNESDDPVEMND
jgi:hypothetical protein